MKKTNPIVLVDKDDKVVGYKEKFLTHKIPVSLHRAISILIMSPDESQMLITKRAMTKPTWGGYWSNAVCTHPYPGETYQKAAERRLFEELGIRTSLKEIFTFTYKAEMPSQGGEHAGEKDCIWGEHELDHVFLGTYDGKIKFDPNEISEYKWMNINELNKDIKSRSGKYTPWFKLIFDRLDV